MAEMANTFRRYMYTNFPVYFLAKKVNVEATGKTSTIKTFWLQKKTTYKVCRVSDHFIMRSIGYRCLSGVLMMHAALYFLINQMDFSMGDLNRASNPKCEQSLIIFYGSCNGG